MNDILAGEDLSEATKKLQRISLEDEVCVDYLHTEVKEHWRAAIDFEFLVLRNPTLQLDPKSVAIAHLLYWRFNVESALEDYAEAMREHLRGADGNDLKYLISEEYLDGRLEMSMVNNFVNPAEWSNPTKISSADALRSAFSESRARYRSDALDAGHLPSHLQVIDDHMLICSDFAESLENNARLNRSLKLVEGLHDQQIVEEVVIFHDDRLVDRDFEGVFLELADYYLGCQIPLSTRMREPDVVDVTADPVKARRHLELASFVAVKENKSVHPNALIHYAFMIDRGIAFEKNEELAAEMLLADARSAESDVSNPTINFYKHFSSGAISEAQRTLKELGYYRGAIDGSPGPMFREAMYKLRSRCADEDDAEARRALETYVGECPIGVPLEKVGASYDRVVIKKFD